MLLSPKIDVEIDVSVADGHTLRRKQARLRVRAAKGERGREPSLPVDDAVQGISPGRGF